MPSPGKKIRSLMANYKKREKMISLHGIRGYFLNSRGYILVLVLIVTTLIVSVSSEFIIMTQTNIAYMKKWTQRTKAVFLAKSGIELAMNILYADDVGAGGDFLSSRQVSSSIDSYADLWALDLPEIPVEDGQLKIEIIDENSKINLSVIYTELSDVNPYYKMLQRFFLNMGFPADHADAILDWVDIDDSRSPYGAETPDYYSTLKPPYSAKNQAMDSIDELLMVKGITPEIYYGLGGGYYGRETNLVDNNKGDVKFDPKKLDKIKGLSNEEKDKSSKSQDTVKIGKEKSRALADYFTVYGNRQNYLDETNKININTASFRVLSALTENMTDDKVTELIRRRLYRPFTTVDEVKDIISGDEGTKIRNNNLSVKSFIFRIISTATMGNSKVKIIAVYNRQNRSFLYWSEE